MTQQRQAPAGAGQPCIWMSAGLVRYKLCDRALDCDRCPLDAALRGEARWVTPPAATERLAPWELRDDRRYSAGHLWVRLSGERARVGVDPLAVRLLGAVCAVAGVAPAALLGRGDRLCTIETPMGAVPLQTPVAGRSAGINPTLASDPSLLLTDPYGAGWLAEILVGPPGAADYAGLLAPAAAREVMPMDLKRFRRRVAMHLLASANGIGTCLADGGEPLGSLAQMLGPVAYLSVVRELLC